MYESQFDNLYLGGKQTTSSGLSGAHALREQRMIAYLQQQRQYQKEEYRKSLLHPEAYEGAKIPSEIPQETATAKLNWNGSITPNSAGRFILIIDPSIQTANLYNDETINGVGTAGSPTTITIDHDSNIIDMFRLVSMSVILTYQGFLDKMSGFITGATSSNLSAATNSTFFNFTNIENIQNKRTVSPIDGIKLVYSPYDNQQLEYQAIGAYSGLTSAHRWKKLIIIYGEGLPPTACLRWDITRNIEYVSKPLLREYIPHIAATPCNFDATILEGVKKSEVTTYKSSITEKDAIAAMNKLGSGAIGNLFANQDKMIAMGQSLIGSYLPHLGGFK